MDKYSDTRHLESFNSLSVEDLTREKLVAELKLDYLNISEALHRNDNVQKTARWEKWKTPANLFALYLGIFLTVFTIWDQLEEISNRISEQTKLVLTSQTLELVDNLGKDEKAETALLLLSTQGLGVVPVLTHHLETGTKIEPIVFTLSLLAQQDPDNRVLIEENLLERANLHLKLHELGSDKVFIAQQNYLQTISSFTTVRIIGACRYVTRVEAKVDAMGEANAKDAAYKIGYKELVKKAKESLGSSCPK